MEQDGQNPACRCRQTLTVWNTCLFHSALLWHCPDTWHTTRLHPSRIPQHSSLLSSPFCSLSGTPGIFRYRSPHYSSIQPQQTHKQISRLRRSQSPSPSSLRRAIRTPHTPQIWAGGRLSAAPALPPPKIPPRHSPMSQLPLIQLKVICEAHSFSGSGKGGFLCHTKKKREEMRPGTWES